LREHYEDIKDSGAEVVAVGTGDERYATAFVEQEHVPFPVLVDDDAEAANAAAVRTIPFLQLLLDPRALRGGRRAHRVGFRIQRSGERVTQLGATYVIGPGSTVRYEHIDKHSADHAPLADVLRAATQPS
jgi:peroxiredoxin